MAKCLFNRDNQIMSNLKWQPLSPGGKIEVIAPGMPFRPENFKKSKKLIEAWGCEVHAPKNILGQHPVSANSTAQRRDFIKKALASESVFIWAARGGYGSLHLLETLDQLKKPKSPKLLIGFSDITTLHQFFNQKWNWPSLHAGHVDRLAFALPERQKLLKDILFGKVKELTFKNLKPMNGVAQKSQSISGSISGGNLTVLQSALGTRWQLQGRGKILFFEDLGERGYRIDRMLTHMELLGVFKGVKALVLGPFTGGDEPDGSNKIRATLLHFAEQQKFPVFTGLKVGHIPDSYFLPLNTRARLQVSKGRGELHVSTGVKV